MLAFINDYLSKICVYFLKHKYDRFKKFKAFIEKQSDKQIKFLRTNNDIEFYGKDLTNFR